MEFANAGRSLGKGMLAAGQEGAPSAGKGAGGRPTTPPGQDARYGAEQRLDLV